MTDRKDIPTIRSVKKEVDGLTQDINQIKDEIPQVEGRLKEVISAKINAGTISTCDVMDKIKTSSESLKAFCYHPSLILLLLTTGNLLGNLPCVM